MIITIGFTTTEFGAVSFVTKAAVWKVLGKYRELLLQKNKFQIISMQKGTCRKLLIYSIQSVFNSLFRNMRSIEKFGNKCVTKNYRNDQWNHVHNIHVRKLVQQIHTTRTRKCTVCKQWKQIKEFQCNYTIIRQKCWGKIEIKLSKAYRNTNMCWTSCCSRAERMRTWR